MNINFNTVTNLSSLEVSKSFKLAAFDSFITMMS